MMNIDWSKAPDGATHWDTGSVPGWMKLEDGQWSWWPVERAACDKKWYPSSDIHPARLARMVGRPWTGEGLPPVGTICECHLPDELTNKYSWQEAKVIWHNGPTECAVIRSTSKLAWCDEFRPIRTAEQIAAEERLRKSAELFEFLYPDSCSWNGLPEEIKTRYLAAYDAGYRKQEQK